MVILAEGVEIRASMPLSVMFSTVALEGALLVTACYS
jgi:hypothetical protein